MTHHMMQLVIQIGLIVFVAKLGNRLFEKLKMPGLLGELIIGILIGPYLLGSISFPGFPNGLFPLTGEFPISTELYGLCTIASIILLFMAGLETDLKLFIRYSVVGSVVGIGGIIFSFAFGILVAILFSSRFLGSFEGFLSPQTLFLGILSAATSVGITARILSEQKKMESPEGVTILAGAVIDDVGGIIVLAIVLGVLNSHMGAGKLDWGKIGIIALKTVVIWLGATIISILASHKISKMLKLFRTRSSIAVLALGLALVVSGLFEEAGLAMIIGAYVTGLALSNTDIRNVVREVLHPIYEFLVPVFFCVMGMLVDLRSISSVPVLVFGLLYTIGAILAKVFGCGLPAFAFSFNAKGALRIGIGMIPRGEVALIIAGIGISSGFIQEKIFGVAVLMTLITTIISPPLLVGTLKIKGIGTNKKVKKEETSIISHEFVSVEQAEFILSNIILLFEEEKFYVNLLNPDENIYQMRKDRTIITVWQEENKLFFQFLKNNEALIRGSLSEAFVGLEKSIRALSSPIDPLKTYAPLFDATTSVDHIGIPSEYFSTQRITNNLKATSKKEIIEELLDMIIIDNPQLDRKKAIKELLAREELISTGLQHGIAIPHAKIEGLSKTMCALGISQKGVDFAALDGKPSHLIFLILGPRSSGTTALELLSMIARKMSESNRKRLLDAETPEKVFTIITETN